MVIAAANRVAVSIDPLHRRVYELRFRATSGWRPDGFVLPCSSSPRSAAWAGEDVAELRAHPGMVTLRRVLWEVEQQALDEAADGDLEAAAHHAFARYLASARRRRERSSVGALVKEHSGSLVVASVLGAVTANWGGLLGFGAGVALGEAPGVALERPSVQAGADQPRVADCLPGARRPGGVDLADTESTAGGQPLRRAGRHTACTREAQNATG